MRRMGRIRRVEAGPASALVAVALLALVGAACSGGAKSATARSSSTTAPVTGPTTTVAALQSPASSTSSTTPAPPCGSAQLQVVFVSVGDAGAKKSGKFEIRNAAPDACSVQGYPTIVMVDSASHALATRTDQVGAPAGGSVTLPGGSPPIGDQPIPGHATFQLSWTDGNGAGCSSPVRPAALAITFGQARPPHQVDAHPSGSGDTISVCGGAFQVSPLAGT